MNDTIKLDFEAAQPMIPTTTPSACGLVDFLPKRNAGWQTGASQWVYFKEPAELEAFGIPNDPRFDRTLVSQLPSFDIDRTYRVQTEHGTHYIEFGFSFDVRKVSNPKYAVSGPVSWAVNRIDDLVVVDGAVQIKGNV